MSTSMRLPGFIAYIPVIGWIYLAIFESRNAFAKFHMRQSVGLVLFLALVTSAWVVIAWLSGWVPFLFTLGMALFSLVLVTYFVGAILWIVGMVNALRCREALLPMIGSYSNRLPI